MEFATAPIVVYVPQLGGFHWSDFASSIAILIAIGSLFVAVRSVKDSEKSSKSNYSLATQQLEQSRIDSQRQYEYVLLQIKRENRIRIYAPLLGYLRALLTDFRGQPLIAPVQSVLIAKSQHAINLETLKENIITYEFWAEFDLLGDPTISESVSVWMRDLENAKDELEDLRELQKEVSVLNPSEQKEPQRELNLLRNQVRQKKKRLAEDLDALKVVILNEFQSEERKFDRTSGGTTGAQENENK